MIGHFNSSSARIASQIYSEASIPLLLPASTSLDLTKVPLTFRICPDDRQQCAAIASFVSKHPLKDISIWTDDSEYSLSLKKLLNEEYFNISNHLVSLDSLDENGILICLGSHYKIASTIKNFKEKYPQLTIVCCDDCSIDEFYHLIENMNNIWAVMPCPNFQVCVKKAIHITLSYLESRSYENFYDWIIQDNKLFTNQENKDSYFKIISIK